MDVQNLLRTFEFGKLEQPVKLHLKNVYATMGLALISCAVGGYINLFTNLLQIGFLSAFGCLGLVIWLLATKPTKDNRGMRFSMLMGISFLTGINMGPHLEYVIHIDPSIVPTAFLATALVFVCFSLCALLSDDRKFLALGGTLGSGLMWLMLLGLLNIFTGSQLLYQVHVYLGLVIMCGFVLYDTQAIVTKFRNGDEDFICHTLDLFLDFIGIFRRLLIILSDNAKKDKRRRD